MPLPNTTGVQNAGVNPNDVQQKNDVNQAMNTFFREFSAKMDNILNVRGNVQAGVFNSFGNNALTRGGMGMTDLLTDTIKGMFTEKEKEKEDPVVKALRTQHAVLVEISKTMLKVDERLFNIDEAAYGIRLDIKNQFSKGNPPSIAPPEDIVEENLVWPKLDDPNPEPKVNPISEVVDPEFNINNFLKRESATDSIDTSPTPTQDITQPVSGAKDFNFSSLLRKESATDAVDISETPREEIKQTSILDSILSVLMSSDKKLDKLVKDKPISTREDELAAKRTTVGGVTIDSPSATASPDASPLMGILGTVIEGLKDFGLGLLALKATFSKLGGIIIRAFTGAASAIAGTLIRGITGVISSLVKSIPGLLLRAIPLLLNPVGLGLLAGAAVVGAGMWAADKIQGADIESGTDIMGDSLTPTAAGDITPQNAVIEEHEKYEATKVNSLNESNKILSSPPIKKVQSDVTSNVNSIEQGQLELKKAQSQQQTSPVRQAAPVIQSSSTTNNQTIMPTRSYPTNTEPGYRRYMDNMLVGG